MSGCGEEDQSETYWDICVLCQEKSQEGLQCPAESKRPDVGAGYKTLASNITRFSMPLQIPLSLLDDGSGIEETFIARKARWHKSCSAKFNSTKLQRVEKRRSS